MQRLSGLMLHLWQREEKLPLFDTEDTANKAVDLTNRMAARRGEARQPEQLRVGRAQRRRRVGYRKHLWRVLIQEYPFPLKSPNSFFPMYPFAGWPRGHSMSTKASVEMYLCAFHLGKWEADESVEDAYHRALSVSAAQFHRMQRDDYATLQEKHAAAIHRMYEAAGVNLKTATEAEKAPLRLRLMDEARKGGMRFPA
jgi:hypothetical protein